MKKSDDYSHIECADLECPPKLEERKKWFGTYQGIRFEINNWHSDFAKEYGYQTGHWTHYIYISIDDQLPDEFKEQFWLKPKYSQYKLDARERVSYDYYTGSIGQLNFHGGCTYYNKETCVDDKYRLVKIGCDYQHLWDEGRYYTLESVFKEVQETVESLYKVVGDIKIRSIGDGKYRYKQDFTHQECLGEL